MRGLGCGVRITVEMKIYCWENEGAEFGGEKISKRKIVKNFEIKIINFIKITVF